MIKEYTNPLRTSLELKHLSLTPKLILYYFYILAKRMRRTLMVCEWGGLPSFYSSLLVGFKEYSRGDPQHTAFHSHYCTA
jgi:hypothetical protein